MLFGYGCKHDLVKWYVSDKFFKQLVFKTTAMLFFQVIKKGDSSLQTMQLILN